MASISLRNLVISLGLALAIAQPLAAQVTPAFTYQGELHAAGTPADANFDMEFRLFDAESGGAQIGPLVTRLDVPINRGLFNVQLDFGAAQFAGDRQWLEVRIRPAGDGDYETLSPRTEVTAAPYALGAVAALADSVTTTSVVDGTLIAADTNSASIQSRVSGSCDAGSSIREIAPGGTVTCEPDDTGTGTVTSIATGAGLVGGPITDSGTISVAPGGIGTAEINPAQVQVRVGGTCPSGQYLQVVNADGTVSCGTDATGAPGWALGGNAGTNPATDFIGTTDAQGFVVRTRNAPSLRIEPSVILFNGVPITSNTIGGSSANHVNANVRGATIAGGGAPIGESDPDTGAESPNRVTDAYGSVGGGYGNRAGNDAGTVIDGAFASVDGGQGNIASGYASAVGGGQVNTASGYGSAIGGGDGNIASGFRSAVGGGQSNTGSGETSAVGGGNNNNASAPASTVAGGQANTASGISSAVGGGRDNSASGFAGVVGGGNTNTASGQSSTVAGGGGNTASGISSTVAGGNINCAGGQFSFAAGRQAKARPGVLSGAAGVGCSGVSSSDANGDNGTFVWADDQAADFVSTGERQFLVRAAGGIYFGTNSTVSIPANRFINTSTDAHLTSGGVWTNASSREYKTGFAAIDPLDVLARVASLPITTWTYRGSEEGRHMGPVAEEFKAAFGLGGDGKSIGTIDADGVALAAIQGLNQKLEAARAENVALRAESTELRDRLDRLEALLVERAREWR